MRASFTLGFYNLLSFNYICRTSGKVYSESLHYLLNLVTSTRVFRLATSAT